MGELERIITIKVTKEHTIIIFFNLLFLIFKDRMWAEDLIGVRGCY